LYSRYKPVAKPKKRALVDARAAIEGAQSPIDVDLLRAVTRRFGRAAADRLEEIF
jgi:hypothetical protein